MLRHSRGNEPLAIDLGPVRGSGARAFHARDRLAIDLCAFGTLKSTMIFALRDSRGNEPLAIGLCAFGTLQINYDLRVARFQGQRAPGYSLGPVRGSGARASTRGSPGYHLCAFGTLQINYDLRVARFQGQRAPGYSPRPRPGLRGESIPRGIAWLSTCVPLAHFKSTMIFALRDSRGNEPLAIHLGPVRGSGARAFHAGDRLAIDLCAFGTLQINYDLRVARFQGQRAPGYSPRPRPGLRGESIPRAGSPGYRLVCLWHTSNQL